MRTSTASSIYVTVRDWSFGALVDPLQVLLEARRTAALRPSPADALADVVRQMRVDSAISVG